MGKASKVKVELRDAVEMAYLIQALKDIADNKFYTLSQQKEKFRRFGETFVEFFRMMSFTKAQHPLLENDHPTVGILVVTIEGSFLGKFNNRILKLALEAKNNYPNYRFIAVGNKAVDRLRPFTPDLKVFSGMERMGMYEMAIEVKNYLMEEILNKRLGKVVVVYSWPKTLDVQKERVVNLLPCKDLISKQAQFVDAYEKVILESQPVDIIGYLANLWVTVRLHEIFLESNIAAAAALASFLEESVDKMKKEKIKAQMKYRKARKNDIDKSLRETFSARMMSIEAK